MGDCRGGFGRDDRLFQDLSFRTLPLRRFVRRSAGGDLRHAGMARVSLGGKEKKKGKPVECLSAMGAGIKEKSRHPIEKE